MPQPTPLSPAGLHLLDRRNFLRTAGTGLGAVALSSLLEREGLLAAEVRDQPGDEAAFPKRPPPIRPVIDPRRPLAARPPHFPPMARNVLVIYCSGACSPLDTFDYKPQLIKRNGQPMPGKEKLITFQGEQGNLTRSPYDFTAPRQVRQNGLQSAAPAGRTGRRHVLHPLDDQQDVHARTGRAVHVDRLHAGRLSQHGRVGELRPGHGSRRLAGFVAIPDPRGVPQSSVANWGPGFLPGGLPGHGLQRPAADPPRQAS